MAKQTSFAHQKKVLGQFASVLSEFESEFKGLVRRYEQDIVSLYENEGLMEEIYEDYSNTYLNPLKSSLSELLARIQEEDIPYIEKELDFIYNINPMIIPNAVMQGANIRQTFCAKSSEYE